MRDRANLIWFLVGLIFCLSVLAIVGVAGAAEPETPKSHHNTFHDLRLLAALDASEDHAVDASELMGTGLLGLVFALAALWVATAWRERRSKRSLSCSGRAFLIGFRQHLRGCNPYRREPRAQTL